MSGNTLRRPTHRRPAHGLADAHDLGRVKMCGVPRPECLAANVAAIAGRFALDAGRLGEIVAHRD